MNPKDYEEKPVFKGEIKPIGIGYAFILLLAFMAGGAWYFGYKLSEYMFKLITGN